jgi:ThiS family.
LDELSIDYGLTKIEFFNSGSGEVYPDCEVLVNGHSHRLLADGLDTKLKDGDKIEIMIIVLPGG